MPVGQKGKAAAIKTAPLLYPICGRRVGRDADPKVAANWL